MVVQTSLTIYHFHYYTDIDYTIPQILRKYCYFGSVNLSYAFNSYK